jgi:hypothetical protein
MKRGFPSAGVGNGSRYRRLALFVAVAFLTVASLVLAFVPSQFVTRVLVSSGLVALASALLVGGFTTPTASAPPEFNAVRRTRQLWLSATILGALGFNGLCQAFPIQTEAIQLPIVFLLVASVFWQGIRL